MSHLRSINRFILISLALLGLSVSSANASVVDSADVSFGSMTYTTFIDTTTSLTWLDLDNFYLGYTFNSVKTALIGSGFHIANEAEMLGLESSIPIVPANFAAEAAIVGGNLAANGGTRDIIWGVYDDENGGNASYTFKGPSSTLWGNALGAIDPDSLFSLQNGSQHNDLGAWVVSDNVISAVPVPAAVWLFGTALIGFVGMSRRRKVA